MAHLPLRADSARDNVIAFPPARPRARADIPAFDPSNPAHQAAWAAIWDLGQHELRLSKSRTVEAMIDVFDLTDSDADLEPDGDEADGCQSAEDEFMMHGHDGPGCPLADPDTAVDDVAIDDDAFDGC